MIIPLRIPNGGFQLFIVTGGAGFVGSNLVHELNVHGISNILIVDNISSPEKIPNLHGTRFVDFMDKKEFRRAIREKSLGVETIEAIFHQGACSNTLEDDGNYVIDNNLQYSKDVLSFAIHQGAPFVYASTAAVYGLSGPGHFSPSIENECPLNVYGFSKLAFDHYVRNLIFSGRIPITIVGLRYFNVYGPREQHKGRMASVIHHFSKQIKETGKIRLFRGTGGYADGEQRRDFVFVRDLVNVNMFFAQVGSFAQKGPERAFQGVVNVGAGHSRSFNEVARALMAVHGEVPIEYVPFPADLVGRYQHFTEADLTGLRDLGYLSEMIPVELGVKETFAQACPLSAAIHKQ
jgi:ADP-L-glycero-D-manno-heptose 6-epimerase